MNEIDDDWRVVFESHNPGACSDHSLVLTAVRIPHRVIHDQSGFALLVPAAQSGDAVRELRLYENENPPSMPKPRPVSDWHDARPGVAGYILVVCLAAWLAGTAAFSSDWLVCAAGGNLLNTLLLDSVHRSIGASTAVFAALGLVAGYVWHAKLMSQERWVYRLGPIVGGIALLAYTGMGGGEENVDVGAHVMGFVSGFAGGVLLVRTMYLLRSAKAQLTAGLLTLGVIAGAWGWALLAS
mgnify:CR=1 FL=1